jgi:hypothetical protein
MNLTIDTPFYMFTVCWKIRVWVLITYLAMLMGWKHNGIKIEDLVDFEPRNYE